MMGRDGLTFKSEAWTPSKVAAASRSEVDECGTPPRSSRAEAGRDAVPGVSGRATDGEAAAETRGRSDLDAVPSDQARPKGRREPYPANTTIRE